MPEETQHIEAQDDRREMRDILRATGVPVISIQPVVFLDNLFTPWARPALIERNTIVYCHQETLEVAWICHEDIANFMIAAMERPELAGRNLPIAGPETVCLPQLTEKLSRAWGRSLTYESQSVDDFCDNLGEAMKGQSSLDMDLVVEQMRRAYTYYRGSNDFNPDMSEVMELLPVKLTPIEVVGEDASLAGECVKNSCQWAVFGLIDEFTIGDELGTGWSNIVIRMLKMETSHEECLNSVLPVSNLTLTP